MQRTALPIAFLIFGFVHTCHTFFNVRSSLHVPNRPRIGRSSVLGDGLDSIEERSGLFTTCTTVFRLLSVLVPARTVHTRFCIRNSRGVARMRTQLSAGMGNENTLLHNAQARASSES